MGFEYELDDAVKKLPEALDDIEELAKTQIPHCQDTLREAAKQIGSEQVNLDVEAMCTTLDGLKDMILQILGTDTDTAEVATLYSEFKLAKKMNMVYNRR